MATPLQEQDKQSRLKTLIAKGKEQGFLTYAEVNDHLPEGIVDRSQKYSNSYKLSSILREIV